MVVFSVFFSWVGWRVRQYDKERQTALMIEELGGSVVWSWGRVTAVELTGTKVTDAGLETLADFPRLKALFLGDTSITDAGLKRLEGLSSLELLSLSLSKVTENGVGQLQLELPHTKILHIQRPRQTQGERLIRGEASSEQRRKEHG
jgi:hypothetical protein